MGYLYIKENKRLFKTATENAGTLRLSETYDRMFVHVFSPILDRFQVPEQDRKYIMAFYIRGLIALITEWIKQDCSDPVENIISVIRQCVVWPDRGREQKMKAESPLAFWKAPDNQTFANPNK